MKLTILFIALSFTLNLHRLKHRTKVISCGPGEIEGILTSGSGTVGLVRCLTIPNLDEFFTFSKESKSYETTYTLKEIVDEKGTLRMLTFDREAFSASSENGKYELTEINPVELVDDDKLLKLSFKGVEQEGDFYRGDYSPSQEEIDTAKTIKSDDSVGSNTKKVLGTAKDKFSNDNVLGKKVQENLFTAKNNPTNLLIFSQIIIACIKIFIEFFFRSFFKNNIVNSGTII
jgi:hypothetical protein